MNSFNPGQRWISNTDSQMGLGTVLSVAERTVTIAFHATGETRTYARHSAPLTRVIFAEGDTLTSREGWRVKVESVTEENGVLTYSGIDEGGNPARLEEGQLEDFLQLNRPLERLCSGLIDEARWFQIRYQTLLKQGRLAKSDLYGLIGCRTALLPHQLYIAHEVAHRYAPRVLLADEVGLGKTIEAGLILNQQLLTGRAGRILIVVPESLVHQWLVEMLRRFNLYFSIFDEERCAALAESSGQENPFHTEQLVLCSLEFIVAAPQRLTQLMEGEWDILVVDEAHHLQWSGHEAGPEYRAIEAIAGKTKGVLLLTATPEQLGKEGHYARLRLLDPDRFPDLDSFLEEEKRYEPVAEAVEELLNEQPFSERAYETIRQTIAESDSLVLLERLKNSAVTTPEHIEARERIVEQLLDRHGTGRVLFRNTRAAVQGFPQRRLHPYPLALPGAYAKSLAALKPAGLAEPHRLLSPELIYQSGTSKEDPHWTRIDPRVNWLSEKLKQLKPHKVLVICASATTALDLAKALKLRAGVPATVFHEGLSLVERDRAAAYFADREQGCQVLICSEIGSEGRNFQFSHHLVLFDLPLNPDLLEQRIGRLDRIGQRQTVNIHVAYLEESAQAIMFHWYHEGLDAFQHTCPAGHPVFVSVAETLLDDLRQIDKGLADMSSLINTTRAIHQELNEALHRGRDRLLEYNSCRPGVAEEIKRRAEAEDNRSGLQEYMETVFDCFGVDMEEHGASSFIIRPGEQMHSPFPGLPDDGLTITYSREMALANEDMHYLTWEHPLVLNGMDMVLSGEHGNAAVCTLADKEMAPGSVLLESIFVLETAAVTGLQVNRYLPPATIRILLDEHGAAHQERLSFAAINRAHSPVPLEIARQVIQMREASIRQLITMSEALAAQQRPALIKSAHQRAAQLLNQEIKRLTALQKINSNVRLEEIAFFADQHRELDHLLDAATLRLDAVRVIVAT